MFLRCAALTVTLCFAGAQGPNTLDKYKDAIHDKVNELRSKGGLEPLTRNAKLDAAEKAGATKEPGKRRENRKERAEQRAKLAPLRERVQQIEKRMAQVEAKKKSQWLPHCSSPCSPRNGARGR